MHSSPQPEAIEAEPPSAHIKVEKPLPSNAIIKEVMACLAESDISSPQYIDYHCSNNDDIKCLKQMGTCEDEQEFIKNTAAMNGLKKISYPIKKLIL